MYKNGREEAWRNGCYGLGRDNFKKNLNVDKKSNSNGNFLM
jgi:hypothetical protein